jgi:6-pyruvoyltetrahydropterin/6-carboxytetrahydropterin synthase
MDKMKTARLTMFREFTFEAAHRMPWLPSSHKCHNMHGHSYKVRLELATIAFSSGGWTRDWGEIDGIFRVHVQDALDHHVLNEVPGLASPTCENLATWIAERLLGEIPELSVVTVFEGPRSGVILRIGG